MEFAISIVAGYLIGSIPTAYLILKRKGRNITAEGSGSVGAYNIYEVSGSKLLGIVVLLIDFAKGAAVVYLLKLFFPGFFIYPMLGLLAAVIAHCYSPWLKFKGGKGLAAAAGGSVLLSPLVAILWILMWVIAYIFRKDIDFGNIAATLLTGALAATSGNILNKYTFPPAESEMLYSITVVLMMLIIFSRHLEPFKLLINRNKKPTRNSIDETV